MARKLGGGHLPSTKPNHEKIEVAAGLAVAEVAMAAVAVTEAVTAAEEATNLL